MARRLAPVLLQLAAMVGVGALLYPYAADWFSTLGHDAQISGYVRKVEAMPDEERRGLLAVARDYNDRLPPGMLRDPYRADSADDSLRSDAAYEEYLRVLPASDDGAIGLLTYPRLGISLPILPGNDDATLARGVGHLYGSSLPVGGPSTHSLLTSHSGLIHASLFTALPRAEVGDAFEVSVLGETLHYRVDGVETVLPEATETLRIVDGEDRVTLFTCTPIGVNSHRLLVHAVRVPGPAPSPSQAIPGDGRAAGFPWWALAFLAGSGAFAFVIFARPRGRRTLQEARS
ncbi:MAG TPA: class C sortase [Arachnia sp.]|nr:class C sortase [Arachnia sp.]